MRSSARVHWLAWAVVVLTTLAVYYNTLSAPLLFDDTLSITHNPSIRSLWPIGPILAPPSECTVAGRPFANFTFALNYAWGELAVQGYHVVNLGLHAAAALLLFGVVRRTLDAMAVSDNSASFRWNGGRDVAPLALCVALIWAAHPLLTSSVTYLSQRTEVLMGLFYLGTLYSFVRGATESRRGWFIVSVVSCLLGILSKEAMITAPITVLLYDRVFVGNSFRDVFRRRWGYYVSLGSTWLVLALLMAGLKDRAVGYGLGVSWWTYALTECRAILTYVRLVLWPSPLVFDYGVSFIDDLATGWAYVLGLALVVGGSLVALFRWPRAGFLAVAFLLILAPTSSVVPIATQPTAENRVYLPAAAAIALFVLGIYRVLGRKSWALLLTGALAAGTLTVQRNSVMADPLRLWTDTVAKRPQNPRAREILGEMLHAKGKLVEAKGHFEAALRLKPDYPEAHNNLGTALARLGDGVGARKHFAEAVRFKPDYASAHNNLGNILLRFGDIEGARTHGETALRLYADPNRLKPDLAEAHNNLGNALLYQGNIPAAQEHYRAALQLNAGFLQARMNLGVTLRLAGAFEEALTHLRAVVHAKPDFAEAHFNLGVVLQQIGRTEESIESFTQAIQYRPDFPEALVNLGQIFLSRGDATRARAYLEEAVRLRPNDAGARASLARAIEAITPGPASAAPRE